MSTTIDDRNASPVTAFDAPAVRQTFLLIGAERSGSTLLRLMLDHHPLISCMFESDFLVPPRLRESPAEYRERLKKDWHFQHSGLTLPREIRSHRHAAEQFLKERAGASGKRIIGATIHHRFLVLPELFPNARYVHLIRDGRPVSASIVQMGWAGTTYYAGRQWFEALHEIEALRHRIAPIDWLEVRYENLVQDPRTTLTSICRHLGVQFDERTLNYHTDTTYRPPDPDNAERWRRKMPPKDIARVEMAAGSMLDAFGYARIFAKATPGRTERAAMWIEDRLARAAFNCRRYGPFLVLARKMLRCVHLRNESIEQRFRSIREAYIQ